ncbi:hypothetical protein [Deinococcus humi]|uniref:Uncharacterized protein n=1 Tax=Deinococcus humi TaxID=662880 RepID=A0A7W8NBV6_9DEIO|nr:hypothetical protein [Deinococcus humi]MBB5361529.1 hypothetical protein [Deinococcus humi]GGO20541.1 hypothetical protein GCM10008949_05890 [Deinococcus humi]
MTQSAQSERAQTALNASGITGAPLMSLERDDALFVLTDDVLVYQDGGGTRRVTLRDLTRIHSDQAGLLRVETPAGTALTASLLGFDVGQVQSFFKGVRSATARAKDLPDSPTPTLGGAKTFGTAPTAASGQRGPQTAGAAAAPKDTAPENTVPEVAGMPASSGTPGTGAQPEPSAPAIPPASTTGSEAEKSSTPEAAGADSNPTPKPQDTATPKPPSTPSSEPTTQAARPAESRKSGGSPENPVVISSSSFSPHVSKPGLGAGGTLDKPDTARPEAAKGNSATPDLRKTQPSAVPAAQTQTAPKIEQPSRPTPRSAVPLPNSAATASRPDRAAAEAHADTPASDSPPVTAPPVTALSKVAAATALARQAGTVESLAGRLKLLAVVLFVGALLLAFFQFTGDQALAGLWTLLSGGVGAIALLALGEMSGLLALIARTPGPTSEAVLDSGHDD